MVRPAENQTGTLASSPLPIWEDEDALLHQTLRAQKLLTYPNDMIEKHGHSVFTKPIDAVMDELSRRLETGEETHLLLNHLDQLTRLRNQALEKTGLKEKGETEFPASRNRKSASALKTGKLASLFNTAAQITRDHIIPFLKNTALPALESGARQGFALTVKAARFTRNSLGPHAKDMIENIEDEIENAKNWLGNLVRDEILDPIENFGERITGAPKRAIAAGVLSAAFIGATSYGLLHEDNAMASVSPSLATSAQTTTPFRYASGSIRQPEQKKFVYFHPGAYQEKTPKFSPPSTKNTPSIGRWDTDAILYNPKYEPLLLAAADEMLKMDRDRFFRKLILTESSGRQLDDNGGPTTSPKGAIGIAQVKPETARYIAPSCFGEELDWKKFRLNENYNFKTGKCYFHEQYDNFGNNILAALAYNGGPGGLGYRLKSFGEPVEDTPESMISLIRSIRNDENRRYVITTMLRADLIPTDKLAKDAMTPNARRSTEEKEERKSYGRSSRDPS